MKNLLYGFHNIIALLKSNPETIELIYLDEKRKDKRQQDLVIFAKNSGIKVELISSLKLDQLISGQQNHQGAIARILNSKNPAITLEEALKNVANKEDSLILILDGITDPQNLGAIVRTADCFGVDCIIIPKDNSAPIENSIVAKASSGAIHNIPVITVNNLTRAIDKLKDNHFWIAGTSLANKSTNLFEFKSTGKIAVVMGNEGSGIRRLVMENCDYLVTIPMSGQTQSLNVSVATGIVLAYIKFMQKKL